VWFLVADADLFVCPECGAERRGTTGGRFHRPTCPRTLGRSNGRGVDAEALEALGARLNPDTRFYAMVRSVSRSQTTVTTGFAIVRDGTAERITRELGDAIGLEYHAGEDGLMLRAGGVPAVMARLAVLVFGPHARPFLWQWL